MDKLLLSIAQSCFNFINPALNNQADFQFSLSNQIKVKEEENVQFSFDVELDNLIKDKLKNESFRIFSEESGWFQTNSNPEYICIYDPFCNSSLANRTFREAAMGISIFKANHEWIYSLILDYQSGVIGLASQDNTIFYQVQSLKEIGLAKHISNSLDNAWVVLTMENKTERSEIHRFSKIIKKSGRLIISSGHYYWLKLALGQIDAYLDPVGGEHLYEMFAAQVAIKAGCIVTDLQGKPFDVSKMLQAFILDPKYVYHPIATQTDSLNQEILSLIT